MASLEIFARFRSNNGVQKVFLMRFVPSSRPSACQHEQSYSPDNWTPARHRTEYPTFHRSAGRDRKKGLREVAARTRQHMCNPICHAIHLGLIQQEPAANLDGIIAPPVKRRYLALPLERLTELLTRI